MSSNLTGAAISSLPAAFTAALQGTGGAAIESTGRIELDRATEKHLRPLGYEIGLWRNAIGLLQSRLAKNRLPAELASFIGHWMPKETPAQPPAELTLLMGETAEGLRLHAASVPFVNDPIWWALLQLPPLRDAWAADLRASHFEHLLKMLPRAWVIDSAPVVPGAEIAGLGLPAWTHLPRLRDQGRSFEIHQEGDAVYHLALNAETALEAWQKAVEEALGRQDRLLVDTPPITQWWLTRYATREEQVILVEAYQATTSDTGWLIQKVALASA